MHKRDEKPSGEFEARAKGVLGRLALRLYEQGALHELPKDETWLLLAERQPCGGSDWKLCRARFDQLQKFGFTAPDVPQRVTEIEGRAVLGAFFEGNDSFSEVIELGALLPPARKKAAN